MTKTLGTFIRQILRAVERPRLSLTAYGDEGAILAATSALIAQLAHLHGWTSDAAAFYGDDYQPYLAMPVKTVPPAVIRNIEVFLEGLLTAYTPLRLVQSDADRRALLEVVHDRLSLDGAAHGAFPVDLMAQLVSAVNCRDLVEVVRGDERWEVLHRCDLLAGLGPYLVEREVGLDPTAPNQRSRQADLAEALLANQKFTISFE